MKIFIAGPHFLQLGEVKIVSVYRKKKRGNIETTLFTVIAHIRTHSYIYIYIYIYIYGVSRHSVNLHFVLFQQEYSDLNLPANL
jgi:hypothetical protein